MCIINKLIIFEEVLKTYQQKKWSVSSQKYSKIQEGREPPRGGDP